MRLGTRVTLLTTSCIGAVGLAIGGVWLVSDETLRTKQDELVTAQAVSIGKTTASQVAATRAAYSSDIVAALKPAGIEFSRAPEKGQAPLPAVFMSHISKLLEQGDKREDVSFVLRSGWNINERQGITATGAASASRAVTESAAAGCEITRNMVYVDRVLRETAEGAKKSAAAGNGFTQLAGNLTGLVEQYKVDAETTEREPETDLVGAAN